MKRLFFAVLSTLFAFEASAQDMGSYFIDSSVSRMDHNAAFAPYNGYILLPGVGNFSLSTSGNMSLGNIFYPIDGSLLPLIDTRVPAATALSGLSEGLNSFGVASKISLFGAGWYTSSRRSFMSFGVNLRTTASASLPYELFEFVKSVPEFTSIGEFGFDVESYAEVVLGYSFPLSDRLYVGVRVKGLLGLFNGALSVESTDVQLSATEWSGVMSGVYSCNFDDAGNNYFISGYGASLDFGVDYYLSKSLRFSAAVNDLGFIRWSSDSNVTESFLLDFSFAGVDVDGGNVADGEIDSSINFGDATTTTLPSSSSVRMLQASANVGLEYLMWSGRMSLGAVYGVDLWRANTVHSFTGALTFKPVHWIALSSNYTLCSTGSSGVGFAMNLYTPVLNLYASSNFLLASKTPQYYLPINQSDTSIAVGISIPVGRKGIRNL